MKRFAEIKNTLPETISIESAEEFMTASSVSNSSYGAPQLRLDPELQRKFSLAVRKVAEHRGYAEQYDRWVAVLSGQQASRSLPLTVADVEFFSLHDEALARLVESDEKE